VWESLEADALSLTEAQRAELDFASRGMSRTPPMSSPGSKSGRACSKNLDAAGRLDTGSGRGVERSTCVVREHTPRARERFARAVEATVEAITESPLPFPVIYRGRRCTGVRRFPYGIFFEIQEHRVVVIACFHGRRNPKRWQAR
jgi:plasmid stabilization system protein ParE